AFERGSVPHNERLEFLGDSVLAAVVAHELFVRQPEEDEGGLSKKKASLVSRATLARWAAEMKLGRHLHLGLGEESTGGRERPSILSNALEAVIGAIYLDAGYEPARRFILDKLLHAEVGGAEPDHKSRLQEVVQKRYKVTPDYRMLKTSGPDHDRTFSVRVQLGARVLGSGKGKSKKEAEQAAAKDALAHMPR
ncbi:MAG TPA: ribonuclease III, partial [Elusimicrobiota bacterium]|nr:ribonuclease III [Elusimicrobiota bacterium]